MTARRSVFWPLLLIALGLLFLLANFGFISGLSWLAILNLWPLLLILIGLDVAFARRWPFATLVAEVLVIAVGIALVATSPTPFPILSGLPGREPFAGGGGRGSADVAAPRGSATAVTATISGGAGRYRVSGGATDLVDAHSANADLRLRSGGASEHPDIHVEQVGPDFGIVRGGAIDIEVRLASDVATSFVMNSGAGEFDVDLSDVRVSEARLNTGAATLGLVLPKPMGDVPVRVNAGASSIVITVPDGVDTRITTSGGVLNLRSDNPRLGQSGSGGCVVCGSSVETSGYGAAKDRVTVTIRAGASSITVR